jgi:cell division septation protein DedD
MAHDVHDDGFHEIQLSGKQLVFLFMATTVVSIVIFLCGVLVGRGTPLGAAGSVAAVDDMQASSALDTNLDETPAAPQSNTPTSVEGLSYPDRLQGTTSAPEPVAPPPPVEKPVEAASSKSNDEPPTTPAPPPPPPPAPAKAASTPAPAAASSTPVPAATGGFTVQVTALKSKADADAIATRLQGKGYRAYVVAPEGGGQVVYKVRVGMNMQRPEAEQIMARLKTEEKFQPWITR